MRPDMQRNRFINNEVFDTEGGGFGMAQKPSVDIVTTFICSTLYLSLPKFLF